MPTADPLTHPAFAGVRWHAWRRTQYAVSTLPSVVRRALRVQAGGWERRMVVQARPGRGRASDYIDNYHHWGRRAA